MRHRVWLGILLGVIAATAHRAPAAQPHRAAPRGLAGLRVLVVDNEAPAREALQPIT